MFVIFGLDPSEMIVGFLCMGVLAGVVILVVVLTTHNNCDGERSFPPAPEGTRLGVPVDEHSGLVRVVESDPELIAVVEAWPAAAFAAGRRWARLTWRGRRTRPTR
jgi:hypothetical protein